MGIGSDDGWGGYGRQGRLLRDIVVRDLAVYLPCCDVPVLRFERHGGAACVTRAHQTRAAGPRKVASFGQTTLFF